MIGATKAKPTATSDEERTIEALRRELEQAERNSVAVDAAGEPEGRRLAEARAVHFGHVELDATADRDKAIARTARLLGPAYTLDQAARLFDAPGARPRALAMLPSLEIAESESDAREAEAHAPLLAARQAVEACPRLGGRPLLVRR